MTSFDDDMVPGKPEDNDTDSDEMDRSLTPPDDIAISPDLLDELFETEDPRVQSGVSEDDSDDDLDFIRMSGLTSPEVSADIDAIDGILDADHKLSPPVSFYEPGVADVDAAMVPEPESAKEPSVPEPPVVENEAQDEVPTAVENDSDVQDVSSDVIESYIDPDDLEMLLAESPAVELDQPSDELDAVDSVELSSAVDEQSTDTDIELDESGEAEPVTEEESTERTEVIDLDAFDDDEIFPDLLSPVAEETEQESEVLCEVEPVSPPIPDLSDEEDSTEYSVAEEESTDDQTLATAAADLSDDVPLDEILLDEQLDDVKNETLTDPLVAVELVVVDPNPVKLVSSEPVVDNVPETESLPSNDEPATVQVSGRRSNRHHRRHQSSLPRMLKAAAVFLVFAGALAYGGYEGYRWFQIQVTNPTTLYYEAEGVAAKGDHLQASRLYEEFVRRNAEHPLSADAMFAAGYQMKQVETEDDQLSHQYKAEALALLGEFARRHPDHPRAGRAQSLMGIVHYSHGDYRAAVDAFIDRDAILRDPAATLPMLRTLARSYAQLGEFEAAHTTYIRAANSPGNPSPDMDYDELGEMYRALAQSADSTDQHSVYQTLALEHWSHAIRYPGINPTRKNAIRLKVDLLGELGAIKGTPTTLSTQAEITDLVVPVQGDTEVYPAKFELTEPLPFGPIIKGVRGNDNPESAEFQETPTVDEPQIETTPPSNEREDAAPEHLAESATESSQMRFHEIAPGEQLYRIAADHGITSEDLMRWNKIEDANHIEVGQRLILYEPALAPE